MLYLQEVKLVKLRDFLLGLSRFLVKFFGGENNVWFSWDDLEKIFFFFNKEIRQLKIF